VEYTNFDVDHTSTIEGKWRLLLRNDHCADSSRSIALLHVDRTARHDQLIRVVTGNKRHRAAKAVSEKRPLVAQVVDT
jgi:hypothetical protein